MEKTNGRKVSKRNSKGDSKAESKKLFLRREMENFIRGMYLFGQNKCWQFQEFRGKKFSVYKMLEKLEKFICLREIQYIGENY